MATRTAARKTARTPARRSKTRSRGSGFRPAVGLYVVLLVAGLVLVWLFRSESKPPVSARPSPASAVPAALTAPQRPSSPAAVPIPAPENASPALEDGAVSNREFWSWRYEDGITGLSRSGRENVQQIASVLRDHPRLLARVQVGSASPTSQAGAMAAERASLIVHTLQEQGVHPAQILIDPNAGLPKQGTVILESR